MIAAGAGSRAAAPADAGPAARPTGAPRVLMLDPNASTPPYDRALCAALARAGAEVTLATSRFLYEELPPPRGFRLDEAFFKAVGGWTGRRLGLAAGGDGRDRLRRLLKAGEYPVDWAIVLASMRRSRPDVVHVQWAVAPELDLAVWRLVRARGVPVVYTVHNLLPHDARPGDAARYGRLYRAADHLIVHGRHAATELARAWGVRPERVTVAPHGPLLEDVAELDRAEARGRLGLPPDAPLILFAGLIEPYKGLDDLLDAFARLETTSNVGASASAPRLIVAGKPNVPLAPIRARLARLGIADRTRIDARFLPRSELAAYLCAADAVALPYRAATSSGMLLAARRFGRPVVATAVGDLAEAIEDGRSGLLVPPRDPAALAAALARLLADPSLAARLGAEGRRATLAEGSWDAAAARTLGAYRAAGAASG